MHALKTLKEIKPKLLHFHGSGGHMTHNKGMIPSNTREDNGIQQVTNQIPCLKQSSGMVSLSVNTQYKANDNSKQW